MDLPRFAKALNEAFRSLSSQASADARPSAVLDLVLPTDAYDINLAPNKRQVALHGENALLARFKEVRLRGRRSVCGFCGWCGVRWGIDTLPSRRTGSGAAQVTLHICHHPVCESLVGFLACIPLP